MRDTPALVRARFPATQAKSPLYLLLRVPVYITPFPIVELRTHKTVETKKKTAMLLAPVTANVSWQGRDLNYTYMYRQQKHNLCCLLDDRFPKK